MAIRHESAVENAASEQPSPRPWVLGDDGRVDLDRAPGPGDAPPDCFAVLGLPRRLMLDPDHLDVRFRSLIRDLHPDRFHVRGADAVQKAERHSSLVNDAWRTLRDFERRVAYLLELTATAAGTQRFQPPPGLLMRMLELNEAVDAVQEAFSHGDAAAAAAAQAELADLQRDVVAARKAVSDRLVAAARAWDAAQDPESPTEAAAAADKALRAGLGEASYLDNLLGRVAAAAQPPDAQPFAPA